MENESVLKREDLIRYWMIGGGNPYYTCLRCKGLYTPSLRINENHHGVKFTPHEIGQVEVFLDNINITKACTEFYAANDGWAIVWVYHADKKPFFCDLKMKGCTGWAQRIFYGNVRFE